MDVCAPAGSPVCDYVWMDTYTRTNISAFDLPFPSVLSSASFLCVSSSVNPCVCLSSQLGDRTVHVALLGFLGTGVH